MFRRLRTSWRNLMHRDRVERDLDDEVRAAFEMLVEEKIAAGASPGDARRSATLQLGRAESIKTHLRQIRAGALWDACIQDARYGLRLLFRNPLFTLTAAPSLAICIGANTTVFTIANRLLFREAAGVADADRLVDIAPVRRDGRFAEPVVPYRMYTEVRDRVTTIEDVYGYQLDLGAMGLRAGGAAERVFSTYVTPNYFTALGIHPVIGRVFTPEESARPESASVVVLSYGFWKRRFNGDAAVLGQALRINDQPRTVIGVTPEGFHGLSVVVADIWLPVLASDQNEFRLAIGGRVKDGVSIRQAAAEVDAIGRALQRDAPKEKVFGDLRDDRGGDSLRLVSAAAVPAVVRVAVYAFLGTLMVLASLVLVIACANVASVLLARATTRRREIAVRLAMGAGRTRLIRQLLIETILLFALGGAAGLALARIMTSSLVLALPALPVPVDTSLPLDGRVIAFTAFVSLIAAVLSGLMPSLQASKTDVVSALKAESQGASDRLPLRSAFVIAQVAFSIVLVVGAGLMVRALQRAVSIDLGFDAKGIEVATLDLSLGGYNSATGAQAVDELLERLRANSAVSDVAAATTLPLGGQRRLCCGLEVTGVAPPRGEQYFQPAWNVVTSGYFNALGIRLLAGRAFTTADRIGAEQVAIVSEAAARQYFPGQLAIGRHVIWQQMPSLLAREPDGAMAAPAIRPVQLTIVGVVGDLKTGTSTRAAVYVPLSQHYEPEIAVVARSTSGQRLTNEIRDSLVLVNPNLPIIAASRLSDQTSPILMQLRVSASVSAGIGLIALLLAGIGIYGLTAYTVAQRTREIGVRLALGAQRADVVRMVLRQGMSLVLIGSAIGMAIAAAASRVLIRILFGVPPLDPLTFGAAALLFTAIGLAACYVPARRAVRISAIDALRYE